MKHVIIFQDDLVKVNETREEAQIAKDKMEKLVESKLLSFNYNKCTCVVLGDKWARKKLVEELEANPLTLGGHTMKLVISEKYLGEFLSINLTESVHTTVKKG